MNIKNITDKAIQVINIALSISMLISAIFVGLKAMKDHIETNKISVESEKTES